MFLDGPSRHVDADNVTEIVLERPVRNVAASFEIGGQRDHVRSEEPGFFNRLGQRDVMVTLAVLASVHQLVIFRDDKRLCDEFDLLRGFCFGFGEIEFVSGAFSKKGRN